MKPSNATNPLSKGVGVYIFNEDGTKILLTQRGPQARHEQYRWEGPGGALEGVETYEAGAQREIMEELGIRIQLGEVIGEYDRVVDSNGDHWEAKIFRATTTETPVIQEPTKCVGFGWFTKEEAAQLRLADYAVKDLKKFGWL